MDNETIKAIQNSKANYLTATNVSYLKLIEKIKALRSKNIPIFIFPISATPDYSVFVDCMMNNNYLIVESVLTFLHLLFGAKIVCKALFLKFDESLFKEYIVNRRADRLTDFICGTFFF